MAFVSRRRATTRASGRGLVSVSAIASLVLVFVQLPPALVGADEGPDKPQKVDLRRVLRVSPISSPHTSRRVEVRAELRKCVRRAEFFLQGVRHDLTAGAVRAGHSFANDGAHELKVRLSGEFVDGGGAFEAVGRLRVTIRQSAEERKEVTALVKQLASDNVQARRRAAKSLVALAPLRAEARLITAAVEDEDAIVRMHSLTSLWVMPSVTGLDAAIIALADKQNVGLAEAMLRNLTGASHTVRRPLTAERVAAQQVVWRRELASRDSEIRRRIGR